MDNLINQREMMDFIKKLALPLCLVLILIMSMSNGSSWISATKFSVN